MANYTFKLPDLGEGTVESEIVEWRVQPGDTVSAEQPLVDMMTDKATVEITSPVSGRVLSLAGKPGDMVAVGSDLIVFDTGNGTAPAASVPAPEATLSAVAAAGKTKAAQPPKERPQTSPAVRKRAREAGVDLGQVAGTGPDGRISNEDLDRHIAGKDTTAGKTPATAHARAEDKPVPSSGKQEIQVIGLRRKIAEKMAESKRHIPHFGYVEECDVTELDALREHLNETRKPDQAKLSYLPFIMKALVRVLRDFPQCNAHFDDGKNIITRHEGVHLGIAAQTGSGLMVPVVKHAESLDLRQLAAEMQRVTEAARKGKATVQELTGSTITITSLGALGGIVTTPIINYPEVAIIGVNKVQKRPVYDDDGMLVPRLMMNLSSSFDHRVVDGYDAALMIQALKSLLEHPATIFL